MCTGLSSGQTITIFDKSHSSPSTFLLMHLLMALEQLFLHVLPDESEKSIAYQRRRKQEGRGGGASAPPNLSQRGLGSTGSEHLLFFMFYSSTNCIIGIQDHILEKYQISKENSIHFCYRCIYISIHSYT